MLQTTIVQEDNTDKPGASSTLHQGKSRQKSGGSDIRAVAMLSTGDDASVVAKVTVPDVFVLAHVMDEAQAGHATVATMPSVFPGDPSGNWLPY